MGAPTALLSVLLLFLPALSHCQLYTLIAPNIFRVDSPEIVVVEAHEYSSPITVEVSIQDFPAKRQVFDETRVTLNSENKFQVSVPIKIPAGRIEQDPRRSQFIYLQAKSDKFQLEKVILVSFHSGYIFIQTDKPIYTPTDKLFYRAFIVTHMLDPSSRAVSIEFMNPDDIIVERKLVSSADRSGIISESYTIPGIVNLGVWKIVAKYEHAPEVNFTTEFEVKEYVLPSFEVTVEPVQKFFYIDDEELRIEITAWFLYGKPVEGTAFVLFGIRDDNEKKSMPDSLRRISIEGGEGHATLTRETIRKSFADMKTLIGHSIYISVTVLTDTGSDMVEAEKSGIKIVESPYKILFTKTPKYFKPGMPLEVMVYVTNPDDSPASGVPLVGRPGDVHGRTQNEGIAKLTINTPGQVANLQITVRTEAENLLPNRQATASMVAQPYKTQGGSNNYLHIGVPSSVVRPGDSIHINFNLNNDAGIQQQIKYFTYLIINKGKIIEVGKQMRESGQSLVTKSLSISREFIPSFRIVAYYYVTRNSQKEIVSDSIWIDVVDSCIGTLKVTAATDADSQVQQPGSQLTLKLTGDPGAKVGLVAVDKAVFVLSKRNKLSQTKIWDVIEKNDIGCTPGGGANNVGVFSDAGLAFQSSVGIGTDSRSALHCPEPTKRKRRSVLLIQSKSHKAAEYRDNPQLKQCCEDGMYENPMGHSCERRAEYIFDGNDCVKAFLDCCNYISKLREEHRRGQLIIARSEVEDGYMSDEDIVSRSQFPESWLWKMETLPASADKSKPTSKTMNIYLKDSITTWEVLAISLSDKKGICVAEPYEITVFKPFFIDLRLPYSVIRNEQVEIRAVLYNYANMDIKVRVELMYSESICSASSAKKKFRQEVTIKRHSSRAVPFTIVPLVIGEVDIEVKGAVHNMLLFDGVKKKLRVVAEGMKIAKSIKSVVLDPAGKGKDGVQEVAVNAIDMKNVVPNTEPETFVSVKGDLVAETIQNSIDGANLKHLIQVPGGCGEQNMMSMTPPVIAAHYLDSTNQWVNLGVERRADAMKYITQGYTQQLAYRKPDSSYAGFQSRPSSTWLTAYVVKVFAMAHRYVAIQSEVLCGAVKWLILHKQKPDGIFTEDSPVSAVYMTGGYAGSEPEASLTAFVLVAMSEAREICHKSVSSLDGSIKKAADYLENRLQSLKRPYAVAIAVYALSLQKRIKDENTLMRFSTGNTYWHDSGSKLYVMEATSYALLALLQLKKFNRVAPVATWLTEQRFYGGGSGSTQATIMVLQALAQYQIDAPLYNEIDLDVSINLPGRSRPIGLRINKDNAIVTRTEKTKITQNFTVVASGTGQGTLSVLTVYNAIVPEEESKCKKFDLHVTVEGTPEAARSAQDEDLTSIYININTRYLGDTRATMTIVDISMLTGFSPDLEYLKRLTKGVDKYIDRFEINNALSDKGSLILYLNEVSNTREEHLRIKANQLFKVGLIQPAAVTVYEYYALENRCTKFYHPARETGLLSKICQAEVCRCAEENCGFLKTYDKLITLDTRIEEACNPGVDYVYKTKLLKREDSNLYDYYTMEIVEVIKAGSDDVAQRSRRRFITHMACRESLNLQIGMEYLIMGQKVDLWDLKTEMTYIIGKGTWIEWWPTEVECQDAKNQKLCEEFVSFAENLMIFGCPN